jgi:apolipoprotein N-acyltransferase
MNTTVPRPVESRSRWLTRSLPALVGGVLMALAPAPLNWWGFAWVGLIPLWWVVFPAPSARQPPTAKLTWQATQLPLILWSLAYHGLALRWITGLHPLTWMGIPWLGSVAIVAFAWSFITFWGVGSVLLWGAGLRWLNQRSSLGTIERILAGTALWCAIEAARALTPLDWTTLAYTQSPGNPWILHLGQLSGNLTVSAAIVAVNGLLAEALRLDQLKLPAKGLFPGGWRGADRQLLGSAVAVGLISHAIGAILYFQPLNDATAEALNVGIIQGNIPTRIKLSGDGIQQAIRNYTIGYRNLAAQGVDAVLTPEGALPFDWASQQPPLLVDAIAQAKVPLWLGSFGQALDADGLLRPTQRLFALNADGAIISAYDKVKLVPLGESMPFESVLGKVIGRLSPLRSYLLPGAVGQTFETGFGRAAIGICYESAFPNLFQAQIQQGANLIITTGNLDPYSEVLMAQHQAHDLMRAIEFDRWTIRATNTGYSGIINPHGQIRWQSPAHQFITHSGQIYRRSTQTLYSRAGNWLTPLLVVALGVVWRIRIQRP